MSGMIDKVRDSLDKKHILLRRVVGGVLAVATLLIAVSCLSYFFTWKQDQSLLADPEVIKDTAKVIANFGGAWGLKIASVFVSEWFGLGSLAVIVALALVSVRCLFGKQKFPVLRYVLLALTGAMILSYALAFISIRFGFNTCFGTGLGGGCGSQMVVWSEHLVGVPVTLCLILALIAAWGYFASSRFSRWLSTETATSGKKRGVTFDFVSKKDESVEVEKKDAENEPVEEKPEQEVPEEPVGSVPVEPVTPDSNTADTDTGKPDDDMPEVVKGEGLTTVVQENLPPIDVRGELPDYKFPTLDLLKDYTSSIYSVSSEELKSNNFKIKATLQTYKIEVREVKAVVGPTITLYKLYPAPGVTVASIMNKDKEIALALNSDRVRLVMLPDSIGIEVPNLKQSIVPLKAVLNNDEFRNSKAELPIAIGYATLAQKVEVFDLADAPHLLVAGATKQGKSVGLNVMIASLLFSKHPSELKFVFIDPKMVEFSSYSRLLHHYLAVLPDSGDAKEELDNSIVKKAPAAEAVLRSLCIEMDARYELMNKAGVNNIVLYNEKYKERHLLPTMGHHYLPYLVTVIDEYSDLIMSAGSSGEDKTRARSITTSIIRLAQKGRAAGIHIILATQRPSVDVITGLIKNNFPARIAFRVFSGTDSKTILDSTGAEKLIGKGDMIYNAGANMVRAQCAFIGNDEIATLTKFIGAQEGYKKSFNTPYYLPEPTDKSDEGGAGALNVNELDERFEEAARLVVTTQKGSTSDLQRRLGMGYAKAGRVMDQLESAGIVGPQEGSKPRQVLIGDIDELELRLKELKANQ